MLSKFVLNVAQEITVQAMKLLGNQEYRNWNQIRKAKSIVANLQLKNDPNTKPIAANPRPNIQDPSKTIVTNPNDKILRQ